MLTIYIIEIHLLREERGLIKAAMIITTVISGTANVTGGAANQTVLPNLDTTVVTTAPEEPASNVTEATPISNVTEATPTSADTTGAKCAVFSLMMSLFILL